MGGGGWRDGGAARGYEGVWDKVGGVEAGREGGGREGQRDGGMDGGTEGLQGAMRGSGIRWEGVEAGREGGGREGGGAAGRRNGWRDGGAARGYEGVWDKVGGGGGKQRGLGGRAGETEGRTDGQPVIPSEPCCSSLNMQEPRKFLLRSAL